MKLLESVTLLKKISKLNLYWGQVGTIVEEYQPQVFEVELSDTLFRINWVPQRKDREKVNNF
ncbi:hypothetical protein PCC8801_4198 [Rippkaea orientalis PCC 8801]|uniref:DUF4926 domain-containing protein n=1 Tax=Rippkaea orientalis (strain PCC 8801 / RF-1) TaxID=41431 RepID=B7K674_RIPO1|nr:DUF4926 domain-containing protein [Rippkaea orientalis]ACK68127.1 hypothetical protein PCC8801_4198 [Rippkaea orientalis PCC 8801]